MMILKDREALGRGRARLVFVHPDDEGLLIKVIRPDIIEKRFGREAPKWRFKQGRRPRQYLSFYREMQEFLVGWAEAGKNPEFVQDIRGFVETDHGLGMVVKAVRTSDGELAPTLAAVVKGGAFDEKARQALERFFEAMLASRIVFSDLNLGALVYQEEAGAFTMIDGLGLTNPIPVKALSRWVNRRSKEKRFARMRAKIAGLLGEQAGEGGR